MPESVILDDGTKAFFIEINPSRVVLFQALVESYEGIATVRTLDREQSLVEVAFPSILEEECQGMLEGIKRLCQWQDCKNKMRAT